MTTKKKQPGNAEGLALLEQIQGKMKGTTDQEVLEAVAGYRSRKRDKASKESKPRRASA